jgi:hypothetical protein
MDRAGKLRRSVRPRETLELYRMRVLGEEYTEARISARVR